ncbi:MAG: hypothetical protein IGS03_05665 [Candidatus Sericytochromatia bacterium]|nr:hypothetical protein [Candidatus Sericytochromatia bacterium]
MRVIWKLAFFVLGLLGLLAGCSLAQPRVALQPHVHYLTDWAYHWGDFAPEGQAQPDGSALQQADWLPTDRPANPPGRDGQRWLWLRVQLPEIAAQQQLYLRGVDEQFAVYNHQGQERYRFGSLQTGDYPGFGWHMIPLQQADSRQFLYFRVRSEHGHIGIFGRPRIAEASEHLQIMIVQDLDRLLVAALLIFSGLLVLLLFVNQPLPGYGWLALFAVSMGLYLICRTEIKQLYYAAPLGWRWLETLSLYMLVPALSLFVGQIFTSRWTWLWTRWIYVQSALSVLVFLLALSGLLSLPQISQPYLWLVLLNMLIGLLVLFKGLRVHRFGGWLTLIGMVFLLGFNGYDTLVSLKVLPWGRSLGHWGLLLFFTSLIFLMKQEVERLHQARQQAEAASRSKSEFLASFSHEVRTPLNAILGFAELLRKSVRGNAQNTEYVEVIYKAGHTLLALLNDILDLSKIEANRMELNLRPVSLSGMLRDIQRLFRLEMAQKGLDWQVQCAESMPEMLLLDDGKLRQILLNLVGNALKFTPAGFVHLRAEAEPLASGQVALRLQVHDSGIGISSADQQRIFEAFYQADSGNNRRFGGTGLGLTISRRLAELMQGQLFLDSTVTPGTCLRLELTAERATAPLPVVPEWLDSAAALPEVAEAYPPETLQALKLHLQGLQNSRSISRFQKLADFLKSCPEASLLNEGQALEQALQVFDIGRMNDLLSRLQQLSEATNT